MGGERVSREREFEVVAEESVRNKKIAGALWMTLAVGLSLACQPGCGPKWPSAASMAVPTPAPPCGVRDTVDFESGTLECWALSTDNAAQVDFFGASGVKPRSGAWSLQASVTNATASGVHAQFELPFASPRDLSGKAVTLWIYLDATLAGGGLQFFTKNSGTGWESGGWISVSSANTGQWVSLTVVPGVGGGASNPHRVTTFGIQLTNLPSGAYGDLYIDDVTIASISPTHTPTATPTPAPAIQGWHFDNVPNTYSNNGIGISPAVPGTWYDNGGSLPQVTGVIGWGQPGAEGSAGCLTSLVSFTAQSQNEKISFTPLVTPWDWSPSGLNARGIRGLVWIDSGVSDGYPGVQISVSSGGSSTWEQAPWAGLTKGGWTFVSFEPTWAGGSAADVKSVWFQINTGTTGTVFAPGTVQLDNIELY